MIKKTFKNQIIFTIIYVLFAFCIILFYSLSKSREIVYPVLVAGFFYIVYLLISIGYSYVHSINLKKLSLGSIECYSFNTERQDAYNMINELHKRYNDKLDIIERNDEENRRFISSCVHNLKTPITVSNLIIQRAKAHEINYDEAIDNLSEENERITDALNKILETQRLEEFAKDYSPERLNIYSEVEEIINENKRLFINSKVFPVLDGNEAYIFFDKKWNKVLVNQIISNAVKYSHDAEDKHIYFNIICKEKEVILEIIDKGIGISEYDLPKVFDAFFTGENGRKGYYSSGIGLYLCKLICQKLGQKIEIESKINVGTTVRITYLTKL